MAPEGPPFYTTTKRGESGCWNERTVIGHFQKARLVGKLEPGCLVSCQTPDNSIRELVN